ncbi:MAG TPA: D-Ala-D-Ala carboxypeptidase family metallohydrolase [Vicinamibacterales bacterium]|nr:D-Ala-D-Ala carboxypeptidase family metallohydrolase [Vicinamibacterales bacterium]HPK72494.1 D-Ala-D-Ala carboxypeptidase family metallohydrolase [Vicinamibacterales bacterium]
MTGPSPHLSWDELACHDAIRTPYPLDWRSDPTRLRALCDAFEAVRAECSLEAGMPCPIIVSSGYRTPEYQAKLAAIPTFRAAQRSQHVQGRALDLVCPRMLTWDQFENAVKRAASRAGSPIRYIEYRPSRQYIHIDVRPTKHLVQETV